MSGKTGRTDGNAVFRLKGDKKMSDFNKNDIKKYNGKFIMEKDLDDLERGLAGSIDGVVSTYRYRACDEENGMVDILRINYDDNSEETVIFGKSDDCPWNGRIWYWCSALQQFYKGIQLSALYLLADCIYFKYLL